MRRCRRVGGRRGVCGWMGSCGLGRGKDYEYPDVDVVDKGNHVIDIVVLFVRVRYAYSIC
jgi:hypothetical protein